jgi:hypothetical protein
LHGTCTISVDNVKIYVPFQAVGLLLEKKNHQLFKFKIHTCKKLFFYMYQIDIKICLKFSLINIIYNTNYYCGL